MILSIRPKDIVIASPSHHMETHGVLLLLLHWQINQSCFVQVKVMSETEMAIVETILLVIEQFCETSSFRTMPRDDDDDDDVPM